LNNFEYDSRARLEVETLAAAGFRVEIIATTEGSSESFHGCPIHRISQWRWPTRKLRFLQFNLLAARIGGKLNADIFHAVDLDTLQAAMWAAEKRNKPVIYEARELYTELESLAGRNAVKRFWRMLERRLIQRARKIITINGSIANELCKRYGIGKPAIIRNVALIPENKNPKDLHAVCGIPREWKILLYQGVLRRGQGLHTALDIMAHLKNTALVYLGDGPLGASLKARANQMGMNDKVRFIGRVSPDDLVNYTTSADVGLLLMEDIALNNRLALPQKLFQYLVAGVPQIVTSMPELESFVTAEGTGLVLHPERPDDMAEKIGHFLFSDDAFQRAKSNCLRSALKHNWKLESEKLVTLYRELEESL